VEFNPFMWRRRLTLSLDVVSVSLQNTLILPADERGTCWIESEQYSDCIHNAI